MKIRKHYPNTLTPEKNYTTSATPSSHTAQVAKQSNTHNKKAYYRDTTPPTKPQNTATNIRTLKKTTRHKQRRTHYKAFTISFKQTAAEDTNSTMPVSGDQPNQSRQRYFYLTTGHKYKEDKPCGCPLYIYNKVEIIY